MQANKQIMQKKIESHVKKVNHEEVNESFGKITCGKSES